MRLTSVVVPEGIEPDGQGEPQEKVEVGDNEGASVSGVQQRTKASV